MPNEPCASEERIRVPIEHPSQQPILSRAERLQACVIRVLEAISAGAPLETLLELIARGVEDIIPEAMASILLVADDGLHLRHGAAPSLPRAYIEAIDGAAIGPAAGSCGTAVYRRQLVVVSDIAHDPYWVNYWALALSHDLRACWSMPVMSAAGTVLAAYAVYHREPRAPVPEDLELLERMAHLVRIAIERDQKDRALWFSEKRLRAIFTSVATGIVCTTPTGEVLHANPAFCTMLGYTETELLTTDLLRLLHPEDRAEFRTLLDELIIGQRVSFALEQRFLTKHDHVALARVSVSAYRTADGVLEGILAVTEDITVQRKVEAERQYLAARLDATLESMSDGFCLVDPSWRFVFVNSAAERVLGRQRRELLGQNMWDAFPEGRLTTAYLEYHRAFAEGQPRVFELFYPPIERWLEVSAHPSAEGLAIYFRDVTERHQQEAELRESEERFRLLSRATNDAIWDWDLIQDTLWWSQGFETLFGFRRDEVEPTIESWTRRIHPDDQERVVSGIRRAIAERRPRWSDQYRFARHDGGYSQVTDRGWTIYDDEGQPVRMVGGITDVTRRLALEEQLRRSQRLESVGQLTGGVAHDFNNLLTVILGNADILVDELAHEPEQQVLAEMIATAAQRGAELTQRLLAFARRQPLDPRVVDVNRLVADMDGLLRRTLGEHIEIEVVRGAGLWQALVDPSQLDSALLNLCLNARDAMPNGGRLTIETANMRLDEEYAAQHVEVRPGQYVMLAVSDTGTGIAPEHLGRVFEPFFTTKEQGKGTGLGLAMVFGFMKQSGGHLNIYSEFGHGTTVRMYLPRSIAANQQRIVSSPVTESVGGSETILLVEDEDLVRQYARDQLVTLGYQVVEAPNGPLALDIIRTRPDIQLLFTDVVMPGGMNGRDLVQLACALRPGLRVLYASGYTESAIVHHGRLDPGVHLLTKPYRRPDLARKVREALA